MEKEAYIPSNWGITSHMCNGYSAAHNCGHSRKHVISGGGEQVTNNAVPSTFPKEWSHMIPPSLHLATMASSGHITPPSLHGRCAVYIGSGTSSMKRARMLTGIFVIGIDIKPTVDAGSRVKHTTVVVDYDDFEGRMGTLVEHSMHGTGFARADNGIIAFDADCNTRSQITMNMNGRCRNPTTGRVDHTKPGAKEAARRDRIDSKAIQWMDSVLHAHSDTECIAKATAWPHGPGGWGFSETDAHTILISPSEVGPRQHHRREEDRIRARKLYHHQCRRKHTTPCLSSTQRRCRLSSYLHSLPKHPRPEPHGHAGTMMPPKQTPTNVPPTSKADALILPDTDLATHAGEQIFGVSRYSEEDPDQSRNDLDSMHTFSAPPPPPPPPQPRKHSP